jgi:hypothetical protein
VQLATPAASEEPKKMKERGSEKTGSRQAGRFQKGQSGNPSGRPRGARNRTTLAAETLLDGESENITRKAVQSALEGNSIALRICMDRILPPRKDRPIHFELPAIRSANDAIKASAALVAAVAEGRLTPSEASELAKLVDTCVRSIEATEFEERLFKLEQAQQS